MHRVHIQKASTHLQVWGSTAYVHIQKDKRSTLCPHFEKCIFIGYPDGYKGWKFYNPTTKRTIISERADFNEHTPISSPTPTLPIIQAHAPCYTAPDIEDTPEDNPLEAPGVLHPGGAPDPVGEQDLMMKRLILHTVSPLIQHIPGHSERP